MQEARWHFELVVQLGSILNTCWICRDANHMIYGFMDAFKKIPEGFWGWTLQGRIDSIPYKKKKKKHERPWYDSVKMKPKLPWKPYDIRNAWTIRYLPRKSFCKEWCQLTLGATCVLHYWTVGVELLGIRLHDTGDATKCPRHWTQSLHCYISFFILVIFFLLCPPNSSFVLEWKNLLFASIYRSMYILKILISTEWRCLESQKRLWSLYFFMLLGG